MVLGDNEKRSNRHECQSQRRVAVPVHCINKKWKRSNSNDRSQRHVPGNCHYHNEDTSGYKHGLRSDHNEAPQSRGNSLAPAKLEPHGKHMPENSKQRSHCHRLIRQKTASNARREMPCQPDCGASFQSIQQQGKDSQYRRFAGNVSRPDVSAPALAHIFPAENAHQQIPERNRTQQVA